MKPTSARSHVPERELEGLTMKMPEDEIEQQLTILLRRVSSIHLSTLPGRNAIDRSAYQILCQLADEGPSGREPWRTRSGWTSQRSPAKPKHW